MKNPFLLLIALLISVTSLAQAPAPIAGQFTLCISQSVTLADAVSGGTWTSSSASIATINTATGLLGGLLPGTSTITYTTIGGSVTTTVTVVPLPCGPTPPFANVCVGATVVETVCTGTWSSSNTGIAIVDSITAAVTGVSAGSVLLVITAAPGCTASGSITVHPPAPPIVGVLTLCAGGASLLADAASGGTWSSGSTAVASVGSATGLVTGSVTGGTLITYTTPAGCTVNASMTVYPLPVSYSVVGGGALCAGGPGYPVSLSGSTPGVTYQLFNGAAAVGSSMASTGSPLDFGPQTTPGIYTVVATTATGCAHTMTDSALIIVNPLPNVYNLSLGGSYCLGGAGVDITLSNSDIGIEYQLFVPGGPTPPAPLPGTGAPLNFGFRTMPAIYEAIAFNPTTGCSDTMNGLATITAVSAPVISGPTAVCTGATIIESAPGFTGGTWSTTGTSVIAINSFTGTVTGLSSGTAVITFTSPAGCTATATITVSLSPSFVSSTPAICAGVTTTINVTPGGGVWSTSGTVVVSISSSGIVTGLAAGTASITYSIGTGCIISRIITVNPLPAPITGSGSICGGGSTNDTTALHDAVSGGSWTSGSLSVATVSSAGLVSGISPGTATITYSLSTGCSVTKVVTANSLPAVYTLTGGGSYCIGGPGVDIALSGSETGVTYLLFLATMPIGIPMSGTGSSIDFGMETTPGIYDAAAINGSGCRSEMSGLDTINITPPPPSYPITGGGTYCTGGTGVNIGLANSDAGTFYQLFIGGTAMGAPVFGTGSSFTFGLFATPGTYGVVATSTVTGCSISLTGSTTVTEAALPTIYTVVGGGDYCSGGAGVIVGLSGSQPGVSYQVYQAGAPIGSPVPGTGAGLDLGHETLTGSYTVIAINTSTTCASNMVGSATVSISPLPATYAVTGGGSRCSFGAGLPIGLDGSNAGVNYALYNGGSLVSSLPGSGAPLSFGLQTLAGTYSITATSSATGCTSNMTGTAIISITPSVTPSVTMTASPGDTVCAGTTVTFTATSVNGGGTPAYQWMVNGIIMSTGNTFSYPPATGDIVFAILTSTAICASPATAVSNHDTMDAYPLPAITGGSSVCLGSSLSLLDSVSGGFWTSSNPAIATIATVGGVTGTVTGVGTGSAIITYTVGTGCSVSTPLIVHPLPVLTVSYSAASCGGAYTLMASGGISYSWAPSAGMTCPTCGVTDVIPSATTGYFVTGTDVNGCSDTAGVTIDGNRISGFISTGGTGTMNVWLIQFDPSDSSLIAIDSTTTCMSGGLPYYQFDDKAAGSYMVKAYQPGGTPGTSGYIPTYGFSSPHWNTASSITHTGATDTMHVNMIYGAVPSGPGFIAGLISSGAGRATSDAPAEGLLVYLTDAVSGQVLTYTYTDAAGAYSFNNLAHYSYVVYPEQFSYATIPSVSISLSSDLPNVSGINFKRHTTARIISPGIITTGVNALQSAANEIKVFPNPTSGTLNIQWNSLQAGTAPVIITDVVGREVYRSAIDINAGTGKTQIDVSSLKSGIYLISIKNEDLEYNGKLMVQ